MTTTEAYAQEIRDWLLGRLSKRRSAEEIRSRRYDVADQPPVLQWWIFEGARYRGLKGPLCDNWATLTRSLSALLATFNPKLRVVDAPEGQVDWPQTFLRAPVAIGRREYVCRSSGVGLSEAERDALFVWICWIAWNWRDWCKKWDMPHADKLERLESLAAIRPNTAPPSHRSLVRAAHASRRSRWPMLRNVVADSLRAVLEPVEMARLPLPENHAVLLELVCTVRILRTLDPEPGAIRWFARETDNEIGTPAATASIQYTLSKERVIQSGLFPPAFEDAIRACDLSVPNRTDIVVVLRTPRRGVRRIVVEVKSGAQEAHAALYQLLVYSQAIERTDDERLFSWAIIESLDKKDGSAHVATTCNALRHGDDDVVAFTGPGSITRIVRALCMEPASRSPSETALAGERSA